MLPGAVEACFGKALVWAVTPEDDHDGLLDALLTDKWPSAASVAKDVIKGKTRWPVGGAFAQMLTMDIDDAVIEFRRRWGHMSLAKSRNAYHWAKGQRPMWGFGNPPVPPAADEVMSIIIASWRQGVTDTATIEADTKSVTVDYEALLTRSILGALYGPVGPWLDPQCLVQQWGRRFTALVGQGLGEAESMVRTVLECGQAWMGDDPMEAAKDHIDASRLAPDEDKPGRLAPSEDARSPQMIRAFLMLGVSGLIHEPTNSKPEART